METVVPFAQYPLRVYRSVQLSLQGHEFLHESDKKHRKRINGTLHTKKQKEFFIELLELPGVLKVAISMTQIIIWKWPGYEWEHIEQEIITTIASCPITQTDLRLQTEIIVKKWKR